MLAFGITTHGGIDKNNGRHIVEFSDEQVSLELLFKENLKLKTKSGLFLWIALCATKYQEFRGYEHFINFAW